MTSIDRRQMLATAAAAVALAPPMTAWARQAETWEARTAMPWAVQEIYAADWNGRVAVAGGLAGRTDAPLHIEDRLGLYDPVTDRWTEGPRLPEARHHPIMVAVGSDLFAIGGYRRSDAGDWTNATEVWTLSPDAEAWSPGPALPAPQAETVGLAHEGRIHLIGGRAPTGSANGQWNDQGDIDTHRILADGRWDTARPAPMARNSAAGAVLDGKLWIAGGRTVAGGGTGRLDRYDPDEDRWDTLAPIPRSHASNNQVGGGLAMVGLDGRLVAFGGEWFESGGGGVFAETWLYDPARDAWSAGPDMMTPRHGLAAAVVDGVAYAIGGSALVSSGATTGVVEALSLSQRKRA